MDDETDFFLRASSLAAAYGSLPYDCLKIHVWAERRVTKLWPTYSSLLSNLWIAVCATTGHAIDRLLTLRWRLLGYLGHPNYGPPLASEGVGYDILVYRRLAPSLSNFSSAIFAEPLDWEPLDTLFNALAEDYREGDELENILQVFVMSIQEEISQTVTVIENSLSAVNDFFADQLARINAILAELESVMNFTESQFVTYRDGYFYFPFRDPNVSGIQVIPSSPAAAVVTDPAQTIRAKANLFDLICTGFHTVLAYLGANRLPRAVYLPGDDSTQLPQWAVTNIADHIAEVHQSLQDLSLCRFEARTGTNPDDKTEVAMPLNDAVGAIAGAISEVALDAQRSHILAAQAARTALTVSNQLGTATFPGSVDLGWRGHVQAPSTNAATIAQTLASIESALNEICIALGISRPDSN